MGRRLWVEPEAIARVPPSQGEFVAPSGAMSSQLTTRLRLARWLGPWTPAERAPQDVVRTERTVPGAEPGDRPLRLVEMRPRTRPVTGTLIVAPGLHFLGPDDPRMDRFLRVLAHAGLLVCAPALPDYLAQILAPATVGDIKRAFDAFDTEGRRPGIFSISFGSWPALRLAASEGYADRIGGVLCFGGFCRWRETMEFCLGLSHADDPNRPRDPLNRPVVFMNLIDSMSDPPGDQAAVVAAWRRYMASTWGRPEMKEGGRHVAVAEEIASLLDGAERTLFLQGCGVAPGGAERCLEALERSGARPWLDLAPHLVGIRAPVVLVHGIDDDVIPYEEMEALAQAMPETAQVTTHLTGLFGHTDRAGVGSYATAVPRLAREARTLWSMLGDLVHIAGVS